MSRRPTKAYDREARAALAEELPRLIREKRVDKIALVLATMTGDSPIDKDRLLSTLAQIHTQWANGKVINRVMRHVLARAERRYREEPHRPTYRVKLPFHYLDDGRDNLGMPLNGDGVLATNPKEWFNKYKAKDAARDALGKLVRVERTVHIYRKKRR